MLESFFQISPLPTDVIVGWYDWRLVALSYLVATFASYIALDITARLRDPSNTELSTTLWLTGGALAMGAGIWSMHFVGMLAFNMQMPMTYDALLTALSMLVAIAASGFALFLLKAKIIHLTNIVVGGIFLGLAIAAMHYTGMAAMTNNMDIHYLPDLFVVSILIAIIASEAALWLALKSTQVVASMRSRLKVVSAFIMGAAICGMHYTGMAAAVFTPKHTAGDTMIMHALNPEIMAISVSGVTFIILGIAFIASTYKESLNQQLLLTARQAGMAEVASSVLHNVGNVLNSVTVSSTVLAEKIQSSKISHLNDLASLLEKHQDDFSTFLLQDPKGKHFPEYIISLAKYWQEEKMTLSNELQSLLKNIEHIRNIIATQQDISKISESEQVVAIENVVEEALLLSGIENQKYDIQVEKQYEQVKPVLVDKVKLLQILVNLIQNARESLNETDNLDKKISIILNHKNGQLNIAIADNGLGIPKENLTRIFAYGYTTKQFGHGFGLHTSAISAKEMGGNLNATSEGKKKGAMFILELPYKCQ